MGSEQERVYEDLRQRLVAGHYAPGAQLREEPLAKEFGLSRTPIRGALRRLVEDGLATADAGQGIHVAEWSDRDIDETFQLRLLLEPHATSLACARGGAELLAQLRKCNDQMATAIGRAKGTSVEEVQVANRSFHHALLQHSGSPRLRAFLSTMIDMPITVRTLHLATPDEIEQSLRHHLDITQAVELRDGDLGMHAMQLHLRMAYSRFMRHRKLWKDGG